MSKEKTPSTPGKRKQKQGSALSGDVQPAAGGELHQIAGEKHLAHVTFWDFISLTPESMHMVMWIMSDRTLPRSLPMIEGFGVHSFRLINDEGISTFVKFHWRPKLGLQSTIWDETVKLCGADQDFHRRNMFEALRWAISPNLISRRIFSRGRPALRQKDGHRE